MAWKLMPRRLRRTHFRHYQCSLTETILHCCIPTFIIATRECYYPPRGRNEAETMEKHTVYALLLMTCSACFLIQARAICQEVALFIVGWDLLHQPPINKMHNRHAHRPISWRQSSHLGSLFPNNSSLCWRNNQQVRLRSLLSGFDSWYTLRVTICFSD